MILSGDSTSGGHEFNETYLEKSPNDKWKPYNNAYKSIYPESALTAGYVVSGKTASRLLDLRSTELLTDDIGNTLEGTYDVSGAKNHQPQENETLGLMYKVGNVANVDRFGGEYMIGDIITDMKFYNVNISGGVVPVSDFPTGYSGESVYCDVEYLVGATLEAVDGTIRVKQGYNSGITYNETVMFVKSKRDYYLKRKNDEAVYGCNPGGADDPDRCGRRHGRRKPDMEAGRQGRESHLDPDETEGTGIPGERTGRRV